MDSEEIDRDQKLAHKFISDGDPTGWFEALYAQANGDDQAIPWENRQPHPTFLEWVARDNFSAKDAGQRALVVACGLGNDAEELARLGFAVTAFDISATAIEWCKRRFPDSTVTYRVTDLFKPPAEWLTAFDFVLDIYTIQALPPPMHAQTAEAIARFIAPGGTLLTSYIGRDPETEPDGPPWPLAKAELDIFQMFGLTEVLFEDFEDDDAVRRFRVEYRA